MQIQFLFLSKVQLGKDNMFDNTVVTCLLSCSLDVTVTWSRSCEQEREESSYYAQPPHTTTFQNALVLKTRHLISHECFNTRTMCKMHLLLILGPRNGPG